MIDIKLELVAALKAATSLPVYYELVYKPGTSPAITYRELENQDLYNGDTMEYSVIRYEIRVWVEPTQMETLISHSLAIDEALKPLGWSRDYSTEVSLDTQLVKILRYVATGYKR